MNRPLLRRGLAILAGLLVFWAITGFLILPPLLRPVVERKLSESLHRPVTLRALAINPFALSATLEGLEVKEKGGAGRFLSFDRLAVNLEAISLFKGGPVIREMTLTRPSVALVRNADGTYNVQDLLDEASKPKPPEEKPLRFSLNNIRVEGGSVDFDDRPVKKKHTIRDIAIGIPFLSNIPSQVEITTQPSFESRVNGAPFAFHGATKPFSGTRETNINLDITDLDLPFYLAYAPAAAPSRLISGRLDAKLTLAFLQSARGESRLVLSGTTVLRKLAAEFRGKPVFQCERLEAALASVDIFGRKARLTSLKFVAPEVWLRRDERTGHSMLEAFVAPAANGPGKAADQPKVVKAPARSALVEVAEIGIERGAIHQEDASYARPFRADLQDLAVSIKGFSTAPGKVASLAASAKIDSDATLKDTGTFSMEPLAVEGEVSLAGLPLKRYAPLYEERVKFDVNDGVLDFKTKYRYSAGTAGKTMLTSLSAELKSPRLTKRGDKQPFFQAPSLKLAGTNVDLTGRELVVGEVASAGGALAVVRDKDGNPDLAKLLAEPPAGAAAAPPQAPWKIALGKLALDGYTVKITDFATRRPARYALTKLDVSLEKLSTARGSRGTLATRFGVDGKGGASAKGPIGLDPMFADLKVEVKTIPLVPIQPYVVQDFKVTLGRGTVSADGSLKFGEANGKASFTYTGNANVAELQVLEESTKRDFLRWDAFSAKGMKAGFNPVFLEISQLALSGFGCDLTIEADGTTSLQRVVGGPAAKAEDASEAAEPGEAAQAPGSAGPPPVAPAPASAAPAPASAAPAPGSAGPPPAAPAPTSAAPASSVAASEKVPIRIDTLTLQGGRIGITDRFIQPNYSATLTDLAGRMTGLSSAEGTVANLNLRGSLANHSPIEITGSVNPLAPTAFADIKATFKGIDLSPFTPYSGKFVGYAIARGSLTMEVAYKLQGRKLAAQNHFLVDQFEFGEKVESKSATKLPVRLAVSLLRDKDGLIDLDLPIEGSLDDPKFQISKVIWKVLGNLIGKAVTAPFSLLGKLLGGSGGGGGGGGGQDFSSVDFADGRDTLDDVAKKKLDALAKALANRPALKLEATGRVSGDKDREALKLVRLERMVKAQKPAGSSKTGEAPAGVDDVVVDEKEYEALLAKAYKKESFSKPRNALGIAKSLPASEMRELMLANLSATDDDLKQLALSRANAVKDYLTTSGKVEAGRIFVLEPGAKPLESGGKPSGSRVDFGLR